MISHEDSDVANGLLKMVNLNHDIDQLAMANRVCLYGHVLRIEGGQDLRRALVLEVDGQEKKGCGGEVCEGGFERGVCFL